MASRTVNGAKSSPESANFAHGLSAEMDACYDMVDALETTSLSSHKKSSLVGSTAFDHKKNKVTVQRPGDQKAYQCGPNFKKNKKTNSDSIKEINRCREMASSRLDLSKCQMHVLPASIRDLAAHLIELHLYSNKLSSLPNEIGTLVHLKTLTLQENSLTRLPETLQGCTKLSMLDVRHNKLSEIPPVIYQLTELNQLLLNFNRIRVVDRAIGNLTNLQGLNLRENKIHNLPAIPGICELRQLCTLDVSHNHLEHLPEDFKTWTSLVELNLATNQLTKLPDDIEHLTNLEVLVLSNNQLKRIPVSIQELKKLRILDVEENNLDSLPPEIGNLPELQRLTVQSNKLTSLPSSIGNLSNLTYLAIAENDLHCLPPTIGRLKNLEKLYLNDNFNLHDLPPELAMCCGLQIMSIENCPLSKIPMEVVSQGPSLVIQYLRLQQSPFAIAP
nr:unnamed protein product [Spirometra erinaceieuropaei]